MIDIFILYNKNWESTSHPVSHRNPKPLKTRRTKSSPRTGLVVRISASHSQSRDLFADGRGSIPRFGNIIMCIKFFPSFFSSTRTALNCLH